MRVRNRDMCAGVEPACVACQPPVRLRCVVIRVVGCVTALTFADFPVQATMVGTVPAMHSTLLFAALQFANVPKSSILNCGVYVVHASKLFAFLLNSSQTQIQACTIAHKTGFTYLRFIH